MFDSIADQHFIVFLYKLLYVFLFTSLFLEFVRLCGNERMLRMNSLIGICIAIFIVVYFGFREYAVGVDTGNYLSIFRRTMQGAETNAGKDMSFYLLIKTLAIFSNERTFFIVMAALYVIPVVVCLKRVYHNYWLYTFLIFLISPNLFLAGANVIRSGVAASIFLLALSYTNKKKRNFFLLTSVTFHLSMLLPLIVFFISKYFRKQQQLFCLLPFFCIVISGILKISIIRYLPLPSRFYIFLNETSRPLDLPKLIMWTLLPIYTYMIYKYITKASDVFYDRLIISYSILCSIYILLYNIPYSERVLYLSEFMIPLLFYYPIHKYINSKLKYIILHLFLLAILIIKSIPAFLY